MNKLRKLTCLLLVVLCMTSFTVPALAYADDSAAASPTESTTAEEPDPTTPVTDDEEDVEIPYTFTISEDGSVVISINGVEWDIDLEDEEDDSTTGRVTTNGGRLNLRTGAGMSYQIIDQLRNGEEVTVIGTEGDWYKVVIPEKTGYVHSDYTKEIESIYPEEYAIYKRLLVDSAIGVPFGPNPIGILAIRNPTRYIKYDSALNIFAYVIHRAMAQQKTIDSSRMALSPDAIKTDKDIIVNFFGSMEICTAQGVLSEREFNAPKCSRVVTYLLLNPKSTFHPLPIVSALWPEEEDKWEATASYVRNYIQDMSYVEIAADEGVSPQAVQQSIARSLIFLKKILAGR